MSKDKVKKIGVVGSGTMGSGIAQIASVNGYSVELIDTDIDIVKANFGRIEKNLKRLERKGDISADECKNTLGRINLSDNFKGLKNSELVIEAVSESFEIKKQVFLNIESNTKESTIIATNTSTLSVTALAMLTKRPENVLGIHFFNPAPVMKLVEIVLTKITSPETLETAKEVAESLGKHPVVTKDRAGFIVNRILLPMINEAIFVLDENPGSEGDIDKAMQLGTNQPIGPLALADLIGLDVTLDVLSVLYEEFGDPKFRPAPLLKEMVRTGYLGRKSGRGFFEYKK